MLCHHPLLLPDLIFHSVIEVEIHITQYSSMGLINVMYGSAGLFMLSYLSLSRGIGACIIVKDYIKCTTIHNAHLWVPLLERDNMTKRYKIFTFIMTIYF